MGNPSLNSENPDDLANLRDFDQLSRAHELAWSLLDEHITDDELAELENLLLTDKTARESYIRCAQLHADLSSHFAPPAQSRGVSESKTLVLGFLGDGLPQFATPSAEDAKS